MSILKLVPTIVACAITLALLTAPARAESKTPPAQLALAAPPAPHTVALVDPPRSSDDPAPAKPASGIATWWPWLVVAAGAAGVAAVIFAASGRDPSCPSGRVCQ